MVVVLVIWEKAGPLHAARRTAGQQVRRRLLRIESIVARLTPELAGKPIHACRSH